MPDRREDLLAAVKTALEVSSVTVNGVVAAKPTDLRVDRHRTRGGDVSQLPYCSPFYMGERHLLEEESDYGVSERTIPVGVLCRVLVPKSETADEALLPLLQWVELACLADDYTLGGIVANAAFDRIDPLDAAEHADTVAEALVRINYTIQTKRWDPRTAP